MLDALRCCGSASAERLGAVVSHLVAIDVEGLLLTLASQGLVTHSAGAFGDWGLTGQGRRVDAERIAVELERAEARADVQTAYENFLALNQSTLDVCSDWQVRSWETRWCSTTIR